MTSGKSELQEAWQMFIFSPDAHLREGQGLAQATQLIQNAAFAPTALPKDNGPLCQATCFGCCVSGLSYFKEHLPHKYQVY